MLDKSQEYLRFALAAAAILIGLSVAYHYVIYIPEKDQAQKIAMESKSLVETEKLQKKEAADSKAALERRTNYRICLSSAQANYDSRWAASCKTRSQAAEKSLSDCISKGFDEAYCRTSYPPFPANDCSLPNSLSDDYDASLQEDKKRCLDEPRSGVLEPL